MPGLDSDIFPVCILVGNYSLIGMQPRVGVYNADHSTNPGRARFPSSTIGNQYSKGVHVDGIIVVRNSQLKMKLSNAK